MIFAGLLTVACGLLAGGLSHQVGVAPILGAILCSACFFRPRELLLVGLGGILVRDLFLGFSLFTLVRLVGILLVVLLVVGLRVRPSLRSLLSGLLLASPVFHITLAVGDWLTGTCLVLPKTAQGLWASLAGSLPYFQRSLFGDLVFTSLFLSAYALAGYWILNLKSQTVP